MAETAVTAALSALRAHSGEISARSVAEEFAADPQRFATMHVALDDLLFDYSKQRIDAATLAQLEALAKAADVEGKRAAMFAGKLINSTEKRAVLHTALRNFSGEPVLVEGRDVMPEIEAERARVAAFANDVREGRLRGALGQPMTDVVNIGIGGSDLGPAMATKALSPFAPANLRSHFVSNVDGADIGDTLRGLDPARTLFIISSKTFTTQETMTNAASARAWIAAALGEAAVGDHFAAVSTQLEKVAQFGIAADRVFGFWDWVGGRYSLWSSIGLPLVIAIGPERFEEFLRGGYEIDQHFREAPILQNIPMLMGLLSVWNRNILGHASQAVIPYDQRLSRFPAYLQQLQMESNGKSVQLDGAPVKESTGAVIWGEPGTNGQHAFFQLLHQGTEVVPVDFLVAAQPTNADAHHHDLLVANAFAQGEALMRGRSPGEAIAIMEKQGQSAEEAARLAPHKTFSGSRPSSTLLYSKLDPRMLGRLIALYEHKVFVEGAIWNINSFDQWGVELGKELASRLAPIVAQADADTSKLDASTAGLIGHLRNLRS
ncbi:glucose-6-phosphate isomerase [Methylocapsa sp. S129]|uniref:glucose-6-phosphate isomerase n=1 Tax=Methylocapsa sp. S129 TaxID=1641869 RepID=UPI00131CFFD0|nr:glucose-6-phosphate isomerase [Methylocapsa sp. S129]